MVFMRVKKHKEYEDGKWITESISGKIIIYSLTNKLIKFGL